MTNNPTKIEIMDSTLRDGEQTNGVSFLPHEKLSIARMLLRDVRWTALRWLRHEYRTARKKP